MRELSRIVTVTDHALDRWRDRVHPDAQAYDILFFLAACDRMQKGSAPQTWIAARRRGGPRLILRPGEHAPLAVVSVICGALKKEQE